MKVQKWLLLLYQIPAKSDSERVRLWRNLQKIGAVMVKNSVSAVPDIAFFRKTIIGIADEIVSIGGEAIVTEGNFLFGLSQDSLLQTYQTQLDAEYKALSQEIREITKEMNQNPSAGELMKWEHKRTKFHSRLNDLNEKLISSVDGAEQCKSSLAAFDKKISRKATKPSGKPSKLKKPVAATWVTRKNLHVDRLASAWLVKKHIDPKAQFLFVDMDHYTHKPEHIRFDVFNGEYGHVGDHCTFETLVESFKIRSPSARALAEVIHDLDIQDQKYDRKETEGIRMALDGIIRGYKDDQLRLQAAMHLFDSLILSLK